MKNEHNPHHHSHRHNPSLEEERQSILERMQMSRETYRRMLSDQPDVIEHRRTGTAHQPEPLAVAPEVAHYRDNRQLSRFSAAQGSFPRSAAMRWAMQHPFMCAAAVAAVVAIGPRRILHTAVSSGAAAKALRTAMSGSAPDTANESRAPQPGLTLRNPSNIDLITRVLTLVAAFAQRSAAQQRRP